MPMPWSSRGAVPGSSSNDLGGAPDGTGAQSSAADDVVKEILDAGGEAVASYDSVATPEGGAAIVQSAVDAFGSVDVLINNAGILRDKSIAKLELPDVEAILDVHLRGAFHTTIPAFRQMKEQGYGRLLFTTSSAGLFGNFGQANYGAAKMGLVGLSRIVALEGAKTNIRSNVIAPAAATRLTKELFGPAMDRMQPEDVVPMSVYLVSEDCEVSGEIYSAMGGRFARVFVGAVPGWIAERPRHRRRRGREPRADPRHDRLHHPRQRLRRARAAAEQGDLDRHDQGLRRRGRHDPVHQARQRRRPTTPTGRGRRARKALEDAGIAYDDDRAGRRRLRATATRPPASARVYELGLTGIPVVNVNNNCSTGSTALYLARQLVEGGIADCVLALGFEKMQRGSLGAGVRRPHEPARQARDRAVRAARA